MLAVVLRKPMTKLALTAEVRRTRKLRRYAATRATHLFSVTGLVVAVVILGHEARAQNVLPGSRTVQVDAIGGVIEADAERCLAG